MEDLNKTQIILLCLLLSFVTSIATGIITASLLSAAPAVVTQTIDRVVEKTIQQVVPATPGEKTKEVTTVVVSEDDKIVDSINKNAKSLVRIKVTPIDGSPETFWSLGMVASDSGLIMASSFTYNELAKYSATFYDGAVYPLQFVAKDDPNKLLFFKAIHGTTDSYPFAPVSFASSDAKLGQTVIAISGEERNKVSIARVSDLVYASADVGVSATSTPIIFVKIDEPMKDFILGLPLLDLSGTVIGIRVMAAADPVNDGFLPVKIIKSVLAKVLKL